MDDYYMNPFNLVEDVDQGRATFSFNTNNSSTAVKMIISPEGVLKIMERDPNISSWCVDREAPNQGCDLYGTRGAFGVCRNNKTPICSCLKGFAPKSQEEWKKGNWNSGCLRRSELFCDQNTSALTSKKGHMDGFWARIGCLTWSRELVDIQVFASNGEDVFIRLAHTELDEHGISTLKVIGSITAVSGFVAWQLWCEGKVLDLIDESMADSYSPSEAMRCIHVGLLCIQDHVADRPSMPAVVSMLSNQTDRPQPKEPTFTVQSLSPNDLQSRSDIIVLLEWNHNI
ncbi:hypothetical protein L6164_001632 [Bauhinia variegata]|uniref:Uncharacterized protein n=1 Tax=Bauhinia variegata TaxID=167791 RepID=A0ACB9QA39_BAUVA|nr:hypothetical protein L6164_001632 [Bauhinia variegata]